MKKLNILLLVHPSLIPPKDSKKYSDLEFQDWITEYDVLMALESLGHTIEVFGVYDNVSELTEKLSSGYYHLAFNLLEELYGDVNKDYLIPSLCESFGIAYTGCTAKGLLVGRDKSLTKKILSYHKIHTPHFLTVKRGSKLIPLSEFRLEFPVIVKCLHEDASKALSQKSVVTNYDKAQERVNFIFDTVDDDVLVEEFIEGRELFVGVIGGRKIECLPVWELVFEKSSKPEKEFYSNRAKFNKDYREKLGVKTKKAQLSDKLEKRLKTIARQAYKSLGLKGHARIDFRMDAMGKAYILEVNTNPNIAMKDEFALSAKHAGIEYHQLIHKLIRNAL